MARLRLILRWTAALIVAVIAYFAVFALGAALWQRFGGDVIMAVNWQVSIGSFVAVLAGTLVLPREQWGIGAFVIWMLIVANYLWPLFLGHFSVGDIYLLDSALSGGCFGYLPMAGLGRPTRRRTHSEQQSMFTHGPWRQLRKFRPVLATLVVSGLVIGAITELYFAWRYHGINGRYRNWVSYEEHPLEFWWWVFVCTLFLAFVFFFVLLAFLSKRHKLRAPPPVENVIRQSALER
jgi:hypothetical protein